MVEITREELDDIVALAIAQLYEELNVTKNIRLHQTGETELIDIHIQHLYNKINKLEAIRRDGFKLVEEGSDE